MLNYPKQITHGAPTNQTRNQPVLIDMQYMKKDYSLQRATYVVVACNIGKLQSNRQRFRQCKICILVGLVIFIYFTYFNWSP